MLHSHDHAHASSLRQLSAALIMVAFGALELVIGYPARNPLLLGDAVHNLADSLHLLLGAGIDYIVHRRRSHALVCRLPLAVGITGTIAPSVVITLIAIFETGHLASLSGRQLVWTICLAWVGVIMNRLAHDRLAHSSGAVEASGKFHLLVDMWVSMGIAGAGASLIVFDSIWPGRVLLYLIALLITIGAAVEVRTQVAGTHAVCIHRPR